jgi:hypothetical protein
MSDLPVVQYLDGATLEEQLMCLEAGLKNSYLFYMIKRIVKERIVKECVDEDPKLALHNILRDGGLKMLLKNAAYHMHIRATFSPRLPAIPGLPIHDYHDEPLECVNIARISWEESINEELCAIADEQHCPLLRLRAGAHVAAVPGATKPTLRFLFDSEDLLDAVERIRSTNSASSSTKLLDWGLVKVCILLWPPDRNFLPYSTPVAPLAFCR